jgi:hypothetical protein
VQAIAFEVAGIAIAIILLIRRRHIDRGPPASPPNARRVGPVPTGLAIQLSSRSVWLPMRVER